MSRSRSRTTPSSVSTASVFTNDVDRARKVAGQLRSGTVGHNAFRTDFGMAFGGFKQSGIGREGGKEGLWPFLETKAVILEGRPDGYGDDRRPCDRGSQFDVAAFSLVREGIHRALPGAPAAREGGSRRRGNYGLRIK